MAGGVPVTKKKVELACQIGNSAVVGQTLPANNKYQSAGPRTRSYPERFKLEGSHC
jgi:hypothetical protein